jgi:hypothetical protein
MPQYTFLYDETDTLAVDFLGRFEDLERGFNHIRRRLNGVGSDLKHLNASKRRDYRAYYTDETRAIIAKACHKDIELFGYEFEDGRSYQEGNRFNELSE